MAEDSMPSRMYKRLVFEMADELGRVRGWQSRVAERLDVSPSYISKIASGDATHIGATPIANAQALLGLEPRYFTEGLEADDPRSYRDFLGAPEIAAGVADRARLGRRLRRDERRQQWAEVADLAEHVRQDFRRGQDDPADRLRLAALAVRTRLLRAVDALLVHSDPSAPDDPEDVADAVGEALADLADAARAMTIGYAALDATERDRSEEA